MQIDHIDLLTSWLIRKIKQTVEADPDKLAVYIIRLLEKQKSDSDLKKYLNEQLKAFFDTETKSFVNSLFDIIQSKKYITETTVLDDQKNLNLDNSSDQEKIIVNEQRSTSKSSSSSRKPLASSKYEKSSSSSKHQSRRTRGRNDRSFSHSDSSADSRSKTRSRSRSIDSTTNNKKNREEDDEDEEENEENKLIGTPSIDDSSTRGWKRDKKRIRENFGHPKPQQPQHYNYNNNNNQYQKQMNNNTSNASSNYDHQYNNNNNNIHHPFYAMPPRQPLPPHTSQIHQAGGADSIPLMQQPTPQMIQNSQYFQQQQLQQRNNVNMLRPVNRPRSLISIPTHEEENNNNRSLNEQQNVYQQANMKPKFQNNGKGIKRSYTHDNQPINQLMDINQMQGHSMPPQQQQFFIPQKIPINNFNPQFVPHHHPHHHQQPQQFISTQQQQQMMMMMMMNKNPNNIENTTSSSVIVRKVPKELNCEEKIREHFQTFGKILNIIINYNNDQNSSLVQFSTHQEAKAACNCSQPVFNNRFIQLSLLNQPHNNMNNKKWGNNNPPMNINTNIPPNKMANSNISESEPVAKKHVKERLDFNNISSPTPLFSASSSVTSPNKVAPSSSFNQQYNKENKIVKESKSIIVSPASGLLTKTVFNSDLPNTTPVSSGESPQVEQPPAIKIPSAPPATGSATKLVNNVQDSVKSLNKQQIDDRKNMILKLNEKTQKLIEEQITQQKVLLQKIEQAKTAEEKNNILTLIKKISEFIEQEKASIVKQSSEFLASTTNDGRKRKLVNNMQTKLSKVPSKPYLISNKLVNYPINTPAVSSNITNTSGTPAFLLSSPTAPIVSKTKTFTNYRQTNSSASVDHRPKELLISEIESEEEKDLIANSLRVLFETLKELICAFGTIETVKNIDDKSIILEFSTRKDAEIAFQKGSIYKNKPLNIKWHKSTTTTTTSINNKNAAIIDEKTSINEGKEEGGEENEEKLLSINSLNENELNSESDIISDIIYAQADEEEFEDDEDEESRLSRPWRA